MIYIGRLPLFFFVSLLGEDIQRLSSHSTKISTGNSSILAVDSKKKANMLIIQLSSLKKSVAMPTMPINMSNIDSTEMMVCSRVSGFMSAFFLYLLGSIAELLSRCYFNTNFAANI
jgi:hypothetical protein